MSERHFGLIVVGDELLSGKRQDRHLAKVIELLAARGLELSWCRFVGDGADLETRTLRETFASGDIVFSCGGIGATPDDRTRMSAAAALGVGLEPHPDGVRALEARFGRPIKPKQRLRLIEFPKGSQIVPNPVNQVPGFSIREHYFVPGFPNMAWPMIEWVLDNIYRPLHAPGMRTEQAITVLNARESDVIPLMDAFVVRYPELRLSCLPATHPDRYELELGVRGSPAAVSAAMQELKTGVEALGLAWKPVILQRQ
ncbi:MAG TPA: competence/damage-inducible protein A [Nitrococcus sp.]|nr:competence/damage-inducible protein A [Nitrococcus sp.]